MRNNLNQDDAAALMHLHRICVLAQKELIELILTANENTAKGMLTTKERAFETAKLNFENFVSTHTETRQEKALDDEREDTKKMVIRALKISTPVVCGDGQIFASERSHLALTLGMALGYITRPDMP